MNKKDNFLVLIATFFNVGRFPFAPGTLASLVTAVVCYVVAIFVQPSIYVQVASIVIVFLVGIPAAAAAERYFNKKDPGQCVIDEVAGQMFVLAFIPQSIFLYSSGFFLFRVFDIIKPFPINRVDKMEGGFWVMLDDILAAFYSVCVMHFFIYLLA